MSNIKKSINKCPECGAISYSIVIVVNGYTIVECDKCDLNYTFNIGDDGQINNLTYDDAYIRNYEVRSAELNKRFLSRIKLIEKYLDGGNLLDIGCSIGLFLKVVSKSSTNWNVCGLELNKKLVSYLKSTTNIRIYNRKLPNTGFKSESFDCVTCFDVLEHSYELKKNVSELKRILKRNGILYIQSPNYDSYFAKIAGPMWDWWTPPDHKLHFSMKYLKEYMASHGFNIVESYSYQPLGIYLLNMKGAFKERFGNRYVFYLFMPILIFINYISVIMNKGALLVILCTKK